MGLIDTSNTMPGQESTLIRPNYGRRIDVSTRYKIEDGKMYVQRSQDCTGIADWCKEQRAIGNTGTSEMRFAGRLPDVEIEKYINETGITYADFMADPEHMRRMLNDPTLADFRIWNGQV